MRIKGINMFKVLKTLPGTCDGSVHISFCYSFTSRSLFMVQYLITLLR